MEVKHNSGFTLIELLVVISIIGLLASVVLVALNGARDKARQARLTADFHQIEIQLDNIRDTKKELLGQVDGSWCTSCYFNNTQTMKSQASALSTNAASWASLGFTTTPIDPWGNPYTLDENEHEFSNSDCRYDEVFSAGPNGIFEWAAAGTDDSMYNVSWWVCTGP